jgi:hypothetical protein
MLKTITYQSTHIHHEDVRQPHVFDRLRAQETPEDKEAFLSLAAYQGNDEILLCRKAQVLLNLQKLDESYSVLKDLQTPLALAVLNICLAALQKPYNANYSFTGEAYAMLLVSKFNNSYENQNYSQCLEIASKGIGACDA